MPKLICLLCRYYHLSIINNAKCQTMRLSFTWQHIRKTWLFMIDINCEILKWRRRITLVGIRSGRWSNNTYWTWWISGDDKRPWELHETTEKKQYSTNVESFKHHCGLFVGIRFNHAGSYSTMWKQIVLLLDSMFRGVFGRFCVWLFFQVNIKRQH